MITSCSEESKKLLEDELESENIVYIDKSYVYELIDKILNIENKNNINKDEFNKHLDKYLEEHPRSKTIINDIKNKWK